MTVHNITLRQLKLGLAAFFLTVCFWTNTQIAVVRAQYDAFCPDCCEHDLQFFSPVDFDFDCQAMRKECGYFFHYDKLSWAFTGDRTTIGNPNVQVLSEIIYDDTNPQDEGIRPPQYAIINGLQNVVPRAAFAWGERYEFGRVDNGNGWSVSILDGPKVNQSEVFASGPQTSGFGSIHINFAAPVRYFSGFRDYFNNSDNTSGLVTNGPGGFSVLLTPDDIDGDLFEGIGTAFIDLDGNGMFDAGEETAVVEDQGDAFEFNVRFNQLNVRNTTETQGIELMKFFRLDNSHKLVKQQNRHFEIGYGVRFLQLRDTFSFDGTSDFFRGTNFVRTSADNQLVGPQIRAKWSSHRGRWNTDVDSRFVFAYNVQNLAQEGTWGENVLTGGLNQSQIAQPTTFSSGRAESDFSPFVELRANSTYRVTSAIALRLGYTAMFIDNISRASQLVQYNLPDWGIGRASQQHIFINGVNFGFDVVY